jgi:hypothetical protein
MANWSDPRIGASQPTTTIRRDVAYDAGLRSHMLSVYNYMTSGVLLTGIVAMLFANWSGAPAVLFGPGPLKYLIMFSPLAFVMVLSFGIGRLSTGTAQLLFWAFAAVMGLSLASIFFFYTASSLASCFFATAGGFAGLSLWGYTTRKDLSGMGTFLIMGLFGLIVAMAINLFLLNNTMQLVTSAIGVLIFAGFTAYHTQQIKSIYFEVAGTAHQQKAAIFGALQLYLDFINMFMFLVRLFASRN